MTNYTCQRCGYTTNRKSNFKNHLNRKFPCKHKPSKTNIKNNTSKNKQKKSNEIPSVLKKNDRNVSRNRMTVKNTSAKCQPVVSQMSARKFECCNCFKIFTTRQAKFKHMKKRCKVKPNSLEEMSIQLKKKDLLINKLVEQVEYLLSKNRESLNYNINSNNKITNNIMVNNYGEENLDYITNKVLKRLASYPASAIPKLIAMKHFNPKYPENHNIKITNIHDKFAKRYKDGKWSIEDKKEVMSELVDDGFAHYDDFKNLKGKELNKKILEKLSKIEFFFDNNKEQLEKNTEITVINGTKDMDI